MTMLKTVTLAAVLIAGGASLALAQGPPTGGYPPISGGAGGNPATNPVMSGPPGPGVILMPAQSTAPAPTTGSRIVRHHMYMSAHHHKTLKTGQQPQ